MINKLTGDPVSEEMQNVLKRLPQMKAFPKAKFPH